MLFFYWEEIFKFWCLKTVYFYLWWTRYDISVTETYKDKFTWNIALDGYYDPVGETQRTNPLHNSSLVWHQMSNRCAHAVMSR